MSLTFAFKWNYDYENADTIIVNNATFGYAAARKLLRDAAAFPAGASLRDYIDKHNARVINGPHKSDADKRPHMTVLGRVNGVTCACYHVYISAQGNASGVAAEATLKTGHKNDDRHAPMINSFKDL